MTLPRHPFCRALAVAVLLWAALGGCAHGSPGLAVTAESEASLAASARPSSASPGFAAPAPTPISTSAPAPHLQPGAFLQRDGAGFRRQGQPFTMRGFNYQPRRYGWSDMQQWDGAQVEEELGLAAALGANTLRVFVDYGYCTDNPDEQDPATRYHPTEGCIQALGRLLDAADRHGLGVIVTLFDFAPGWLFIDQARYDIAGLYLDEMVAPFAGDPRILAWDLLNEGDLLPRRYGTPLDKVLGFYRAMAARLRALDPNHLITAGFGDIGLVGQAADFVDFLSFHYYGDPSELTQRVQALRSQVGSDIPIVAGEIGYASEGEPGKSAADQARIVRGYLDGALTQARLAGALIWQLNDIDPAPAARNRLPALQLPAPEFHMGALDLSLQYKPAAGGIEGYFTPGYCAGDARLVFRFSQVATQPLPNGDARHLAVGLWAMRVLDGGGETLRDLHFGTLEANLIEGEGWYNNEQVGEDTFQWMGSLDGDAALCLALPPAASALVLRAHALEAGTILTVEMRRRQLRPVVLGTEPGEYRIAVQPVVKAWGVFLPLMQ